jgi:hypothetical protein
MMAPYALYQLTPEQAVSYDQGGFHELRVFEDVLEWAEALDPALPVLVLTPESHIAFSLTPAGGAYEIQ